MAIQLIGTSSLPSHPIKRCNCQLLVNLTMEITVFCDFEVW